MRPCCHFTKRNLWIRNLVKPRKRRIWHAYGRYSLSRINPSEKKGTYLLPQGKVSLWANTKTESMEKEMRKKFKKKNEKNSKKDWKLWIFLISYNKKKENVRKHTNSNIFTSPSLYLLLLQCVSWENLKEYLTWFFLLPFCFL